MDCHRHYEAIMAGDVPIVEDNPKIKSKYPKLPILYTRDYSELTTEYLTKKYNEFLNQEWDFSKMFLSMYDEYAQNEIKLNGNAWGYTLTRKIWYC